MVDDNYILELNPDYMQFDPVGSETAVFSDEANGQVSNGFRVARTKVDGLKMVISSFGSSDIRCQAARCGWH